MKYQQLSLLIENSDEDTQRKIVESAAKKAGYNILNVYHGSNASIIRFDPTFTGKGNDQYGSGFYFTNDIDIANSYKSSDKGTIIKAHLYMKNPIKFGKDDSNMRAMRLKYNEVVKLISMAPNILDGENSPLVDWIDKGGRPFNRKDIMDVAKNYENPLQIENDFYRSNPTELRENLAKVTGHDGVQVDWGDGRFFYIVWFPWQVKSADLITYDDNNNPIPIEKRFDKNSDDTRY